MFSSSNGKDSKNKKAQAVNSSSLAPTNSLVQGTRIEGNIFTENDIRIDGKLSGTLNCKGKVIIGTTGDIEGEVQCVNAVVEGKFNGLLLVAELLHVKETAKIEGDINTAKLIVQSGAVFEVNCKMGAQASQKKTTKSGAEKPFELGELSKAVNQ